MAFTTGYQAASPGSRNDGDVGRPGRVFNAYDTPYHRRRSLSRARMGPISAVTAFRFVLATVGAGT